MDPNGMGFEDDDGVSPGWLVAYVYRSMYMAVKLWNGFPGGSRDDNGHGQGGGGKPREEKEYGGFYVGSGKSPAVIYCAYTYLGI